MHTPTPTHIFHLSVAPGDYGALTEFHLGPFSNNVHQLSFNVSIINDNTPEDAEVFNASLTIESTDEARLGNRVRVSPDIATVTIQDNDGKPEVLIMYLLAVHLTSKLILFTQL